MKTIEDILAEHPFFKGMQENYVKLIAGCGKNLQFKKGETLFTLGEEANYFYLVRAGKILIEIHVPPQGVIPLQTVGAGNIVGWSWLFPPYEWSFYGKTMEPTRVIALDGKCLRTKCEDDHSLGYALMKRFAKIMIERLEATRMQLLDVYGSRATDA